jgi:adenylate cyclase
MDSDEITFGPFRLDLRRRELARDGETIRLHVHAIGILCELAAAKGEVVSKDELMSRLWPGRIVEEGNLHVHISALRKALGGHGEGHSYIVTVPGRGYRLATGWRSARLAEPSFPSSLPLPDKPSIAVMPFGNLSGDPEQEYFADGMVEEIITALSRIRWLFVIARNSTSTYKGQPIDLRRIGRELGVRYVLEGSVRKSGGQVRIAAQLIEAESGTHLWGDHFDGSLEEVFELQDRVAISVAGAIEPTLQAAERRRSVGRPTDDLTAYDFYLRALCAYYPISRQRAFDTLQLLRQAIAIDSRYGPAMSWTAIVLMRLYREGWAADPEAIRQEAVDLARQALQIAEDDPGILANAAFVLANFGEDIGAMIGLVDHALALTPSFARGWFLSGALQLWAGHHDLAIEHAKAALRLSPRERSGTPHSLIGEANFYKHEFDEAAAQLLISINNNPGFPHSFQVLAACYGEMGRFDEARAIVARLRAITPLILPSVAHLRRPEDRELFLSGMRIAAGDAT